MVNGEAGKGDGRRPCMVSREIENLRWALKEGRITFKQYERKMKKIKAKK